MLPGSTPTRKSRGPDGRATEIQRLIGRSLRAVVDTKALGPWTIHVDADVLEADGGTRTAAITAAFVAVADALRRPVRRRRPRRSSATASRPSASGSSTASRSLDLDYVEDSTAEVDMNVVRLGRGGLVEVQGTGEAGVFSREQLDRLLDLADARDRPARRAPARGAWATTGRSPD